MRSVWVVLLVLGMTVTISSCSIFERVFDRKKPSCAPAESLRPEPYGPRDRPVGYNAAIAWINICQRDASNTDGYAMVYSLNLIGVTSTGSWVPVYQQNYDVGYIAGGFFSRSPWFAQMRAGQDVFSLSANALYVPTGEKSDGVFHPWQARWPRPSLTMEITRVIATADIQCFGNAVAQVGADYWPEPDSTTASEPPAEVFEAGASRWISAADGRIMIRLGE